VVDLATSVLLLLLFPVAVLFVKEPLEFVKNCLKVLLGKRTWVGYIKEEGEQAYLPNLRKGVLPPFHILHGYDPPKEVKVQLNIAYAQNYNASNDVGFILKNLKFLGIKS
jgi:hypothetical protein